MVGDPAAVPLFRIDIHVGREIHTSAIEQTFRLDESTPVTVKLVPTIEHQAITNFVEHDVKKMSVPMFNKRWD